MRRFKSPWRQSGSRSRRGSDVPCERPVHSRDGPAACTSRGPPLTRRSRAYTAASAWTWSWTRPSWSRCGWASISPPGGRRWSMRPRLLWEVLSDERGVTCAPFLRRAAAWFAAHGVTIERVMADNGSGYVSKAFRGVIASLRVKHIRTRPLHASHQWKRPSASSRPVNASGPTLDRTPTPATEPPPSPSSSATTTAIAPHWGLNGKTPQLRLSDLAHNLPDCTSSQFPSRWARHRVPSSETRLAKRRYAPATPAGNWRKNEMPV